jgi:MoaA/NifB/PqqE/SkfB family radical SAM enzyme
VEPRQQCEIQLGHVCNNRCAFCVSGRLTALGLARPQASDPHREALRAAAAAGHRKVTFVGGEPTLVRGFDDLVREAAALGFEEIVVFSNGVKTAREDFVAALVAAAGPGRLRLRLSFQGGDAASHDRTTGRAGSFERLVRTLDAADRLGVPVSVNTCVVASNHASLAHFPRLFAGRGVTQVHVDALRDPGDLSEASLREITPRFSEQAPTLLAMVEGFPKGFDVNVGNFPFCVEPRLAHVIHHDGEPTTLVAQSPDGVRAALDKYVVRGDKRAKVPSCDRCVLAPRCAGVPLPYLRFFGSDELVPLTPERLRARADVAALFHVHLAALLEATLRQWVPPEPFGLARVLRGDGAIEVTFEAPAGLVARVVAPGGGLAGRALCALEVSSWPADRASARRCLAALWDALAPQGGAEEHPLGDDAEVTLAPRVAARLRRLRAAAPFAPLQWTEVRARRDGSRVELVLDAGDGGGAILWLAAEAPEVGYALRGSVREQALRAGIGAIFHALRARV